jgi:hypothetical protein
MAHETTKGTHALDPELAALLAGPWVVDGEKLCQALDAALREAASGYLTVEGLMARVRDARPAQVRPEALPELAAALRAEGWSPPERRVISHERVGRAAGRPAAAGPRWTLDGEPVEDVAGLDLTDDERRTAALLRPGDSMPVGGGAAATFVLRREA